jgi:serine/threonine protein kinase
MGVVYCARHLRLDRVDALKVIAPGLAQDPRFRSRFERESQVAAAINHPNVITIYHAGEEDERLYLTMQFIEGTDLRSELERCGQLEPDRAVRIIAQVASALDAAHQQGLVHRDVKPANVLIADPGQTDHVYLTDFGLTKRLESHGHETRTGMFVGTTAYIAPEQVEGGPLDKRADVYSLGCVLYHVLAGNVPYPRDNEIAAATAHVNVPPPSLSAARPALAPAFDPVIARAMEKDPTKRYASAGELAAAARGAADASSTRIAEARSTMTDVGLERTRTGEMAAAGWYPEPDTQRLRYWSGSAWGPYADQPQEPGGEEPPGKKRKSRGRRWAALAALVAAAIIAAVLLISAGSGGTTAKNGLALTSSTTTSAPPTSTSTTPSSSTTSTSSSTSQPPSGPQLGPQLTAQQLAATLTPLAEFNNLLDPADQGTLYPDTSAYALQGGLPVLKLCNAAIPVQGLGADSNSAYNSGTTRYYGSDAASLAGQGAQQLLSTAGAQAQTCGWRSLPGPQLDDQVVRLTTDQNGPGSSPLHDDVILIRDTATVLEIGSATASGSHSSDAEKIAEDGAKRLALAVKMAS